MPTEEKSGLRGGNCAVTAVRFAQTIEIYGVISETTVEIGVITPRDKNYAQTAAKSEQEEWSFTTTVGNCAWTEEIYGLTYATSGEIGATRDGTSSR